ncbi:MAG: M28 family peptidase [Bdellovibrio sp.]|nr:M28 family peptidase [Bdellovibrio sp.]
MTNLNAVYRIKILSISLVLFSCLSAFGDSSGTGSSSATKTVREVPFNPPSRYLSLLPFIEKFKMDDVRKSLMLFLEKTHPSRLVGKPGHAKTPGVISEILAGFTATIPASQTNCCVVTQEAFTPDLTRARKMYQDDFAREIAAKFKPNHPTYTRWKAFTDDTLKFLNTLSKVPGTNVVWERKGTLDPESVLILGAHFDSMAHDPKSLKIIEKVKTQGADDNGSGVAVAISLVRLLSQIPLPKTVRIVFYDYGQVASLGAVAMAKQNKDLIKSAKFAGHIDLIRLGHDSRDQDIEKKYGNMSLYLRDPEAPGAAQAQKLARLFQEAGKRTVSGIQFEINANDFNQGNGAAYWDLDAPTLIFTQNMESDMNPNYHTADDFAETLNYQTLYKSYQFIATGVLAWAFDIVK